MSAIEEQPTPRGGFHPVSVGHLVMGLVLLGLAGVWALVADGVADHHDLRWLLPIPWVVAGAVGLAATAVAGTRRHAPARAASRSASRSGSARTATGELSARTPRTMTRPRRRHDHGRPERPADR